MNWGEEFKPAIREASDGREAANQENRDRDKRNMQKVDAINDFLDGLKPWLRSGNNVNGCFEEVREQHHGQSTDMSTRIALVNPRGSIDLDGRLSTPTYYLDIRIDEESEEVSCSTSWETAPEFLEKSEDVEEVLKAALRILA